MKAIFKVPLKYGIIAGVLGFCLTIGLFFMGRHPLLIPVYTDFRIILFSVFIFFTLKEIRDVYQNGQLYFSQGIVSSFILVMIYALVASFLIGVFGTFNKSFVDQFIKGSMDFLNSIPKEDVERIGKDVFERNLKSLPATNAVNLASQYFVQCFLIGVFISIILSVILRRQPKP